MLANFCFSDPMSFENILLLILMAQTLCFGFQTTHAGILLTKLGGNPETLLDLSFPDKFTRLLDRSKESPKAIKQLTRLFPNRVPIQLPEYASGLHI
ncbi:hypothetical protein Ahy_B01g051902 [Arachis hypogaea]|uniref:Uncharacterized protein n=1 Tax=Arachis hypogaea TaxID=3818 RepID=A0A445ANA7_ARAHY|nr:hypothetical protein Ahy_B01g051902 [Arachis hypogaea]